MIELSLEKLEKIKSNFAGKRIAVLGDLMIDKYYWGKVDRISPEAPVPVVEVAEESARLGGAANVANNIASLGGIPIMIGVIGNDNSGQLLKTLISNNNFPIDGIVVDNTRPTTIKTRVIAHGQHVVRIDKENKNNINEATENNILSIIKKQINFLDGIILEDYNKGVLTKNLITKTIELAKENNKIITVDPKFNNFFCYNNVTVFKPNRKETEEALGCRLRTLEDIKRAALELQKRLNAQNILLTLGDKGMFLQDANGNSSHVETKAKHVADVSGAGDTVIATLTMALIAGASIKEAAAIANYAGGIVCGEVGIAPIDPKILFETILGDKK